MSDFSTDWLDLREPADRRARNAAGISALLDRVPDSPHVVDLGAGTGATVRALGERLPGNPTWRLIDKDEALLSTARSRLSSDHADIPIQTKAIDLNSDLGLALADAPALVTSSALIDLCSRAWLERFADALQPPTIVYMALNYTGLEHWYPGHQTEAKALNAFHAHQRGDKGFGPALGQQASETLTRMLRQRGWTVRTFDSPWLLGPDDQPLIEALADGSADAVAQMGALDTEAHHDWHAARRAASHVKIGHVDLLAWHEDA